MMRRTPLQRLYRREYHYFLNERGQLYHIYDVDKFLAGGRPSGPAALQDSKFLDFFWHNLRRCPRCAPCDGSFTYLSVCGPEANYLAVEDAPVVFQSIADRPTAAATPISGASPSPSSDAPHGGCGELRYAGTKTAPFAPDQLRECDGRLYHPAPAHIAAAAVVPRSARQAITDPALLGPRPTRWVLQASDVPESALAANENGAVAYGVLASQVALELGFDCIDEVDPDGAGAQQPGRREGRYKIDLGGEWVIPPLPPVPGTL